MGRLTATGSSRPVPVQAGAPETRRRRVRSAGERSASAVAGTPTRRGTPAMRRLGSPLIMLGWSTNLLQTSRSGGRDKRRSTASFADRAGSPAGLEPGDIRDLDRRRHHRSGAISRQAAARAGRCRRSTAGLLVRRGRRRPASAGRCGIAPRRGGIASRGRNTGRPRPLSGRPAQARRSSSGRSPSVWRRCPGRLVPATRPPPRSRS